MLLMMLMTIRIHYAIRAFNRIQFSVVEALSKLNRHAAHADTLASRAESFHLGSCTVFGVPLNGDWLAGSPLKAPHTAHTPKHASHALI